MLCIKPKTPFKEASKTYKSLSYYGFSRYVLKHKRSISFSLFYAFNYFPKYLHTFFPLFLFYNTNSFYRYFNKNTRFLFFHLLEYPLLKTIDASFIHCIFMKRNGSKKIFISLFLKYNAQNRNNMPLLFY